MEPEKFVLPWPFVLTGADEKPERVYTRDELLTYLRAGKSKCYALIASLTDEIAGSLWTNVSKTMTYPVIELLLYNMRHVQHHAGQLNLLLRQGIDDAPGWVYRAG